MPSNESPFKQGVRQVELQLGGVMNACNVLLLTAVVSASVAFVGCKNTNVSHADAEAPSVADSRPDNSAGTIGSGKSIFVTYCSGCHRLPAEQQSNDASATGLIRASTRSVMSAEEIQSLVTNPPDGMMPSLPLSKDELASLVGYLQQVPQQVLSVRGR